MNDGSLGIAKARVEVALEHYQDALDRRIGRGGGRRSLQPACGRRLPYNCTAYQRLQELAPLHAGRIVTGALLVESMEEFGLEFQVHAFLSCIAYARKFFTIYVDGRNFLVAQAKTSSQT